MDCCSIAIAEGPVARMGGSQFSLCTSGGGTERLSFRSKNNFSILLNSNWIINQFFELSNSFSGRGPMLRRQKTVPRNMGGSPQLAGKYLFIYLGPSPDGRSGSEVV